MRRMALVLLVGGALQLGPVAPSLQPAHAGCFTGCLVPPTSCGQACDESKRFQKALENFNTAADQYTADPTEANFQAAEALSEKAAKIADEIGAKAQREADKRAEKCQKAQDKGDPKKIGKFCPV